MNGSGMSSSSSILSPAGIARQDSIVAGVRGPRPRGSSGGGGPGPGRLLEGVIALERGRPNRTRPDPPAGGLRTHLGGAVSARRWPRSDGDPSWGRFRPTQAVCGPPDRVRRRDGRVVHPRRGRTTRDSPISCIFTWPPTRGSLVRIKGVIRGWGDGITTASEAPPSLSEKGLEGSNSGPGRHSSSAHRAWSSSHSRSPFRVRGQLLGTDLVRVAEFLGHPRGTLHGLPQIAEKLVLRLDPDHSPTVEDLIGEFRHCDHTGRTQAAVPLPSRMKNCRRMSRVPSIRPIRSRRSPTSPRNSLIS